MPVEVRQRVPLAHDEEDQEGEDQPGEAPLEGQPGPRVARADLPDARGGRARPLQQCGWLLRRRPRCTHPENVTLVERSLIQAIESVLVDRSGRLARWTGDDAAVVSARPLAVTSIDSVADGVHFHLATHSPADVGWKALATALSDLAAMGAEAGEAYVALALPEGFEGALELVGGMEELAVRCGATIAGGDVIRAPALIVTVSVTGWADSEDELVGRDGARPGDLVAVTGALGGAEAARLLLERGGAGARGDAAPAPAARAAAGGGTGARRGREPRR